MSLQTSFISGLEHDARPSRRARTGKQKEGYLDAELAACRLAGLGVVFRVPNEWQVIANRGSIVTAVPGRRTGPDYVGVLASGRGVGIECKSITPPRLKSGELGAVRFDLSNIEQHQCDDLDAFERSGGIALVVMVVGSPALNGYYLRVPARIVIEAKRSGRVSLLGDVLDKYRLKPSALLLSGL